jgi:hypothetical protein
MSNAPRANALSRLVVTKENPPHPTMIARTLKDLASFSSMQGVEKGKLQGQGKGHARVVCMLGLAL